MNEQEEHGLLTNEERVEQEAEEKRWQEHTDAEGNFRSLGHMYRYYDQMPDMVEGDPNPFSYTADQEEKWEQHRDSMRARKAGIEVVKEGVLEAERIRQGPDPSIPDDPHASERLALQNKIRELELKAEAARQRGETRPGYTAHDYVQRAESYFKDLQKLPAPMKQRVLAHRDYEQENNAVELLFDPKQADNPIWNDPRMLNDAPIAVARANARARKYVRLPMEDSPYGNIAEVKPRNMVKIELPEGELPRFVRDVYHAGGPTDPYSIFRKSWAWLHRVGFASLAKPAFESPKVTVKGVEEPEKAKPKAKAKPEHPHQIIARPGMFGGK